MAKREFTKEVIQRIIYLHRLCGYTTAEIANILNLSIPEVSRWIELYNCSLEQFNAVLATRN